VLTRFDAPAIGGTPVPVSYMVVNRGSKPSGPFDTSIRMSPDSTVDLQDPLILSQHTANLDPGDSIVVSTTLDLPPEPRGSVFLGVAVDEANHVDEHVESNNRRIAPYAYASPRILVIRDLPNDQRQGVVAVPPDAVAAARSSPDDAYRRDAERGTASSVRADGSSTNDRRLTSGDSSVGIFSRVHVRAATSDWSIHDSPSVLG
jgi:hypothetical protein